MATGETTTEGPRTLEPVSVLPEDRPRAPSQPCAACGTLLDPLRAERMLVFDDGYQIM